MAAVDRPVVEVYTDGACSGNPGPGGYGVILVHPRTGARRELSASYQRTTNNRMEIMAAIAGLEALKGSCRVTLFSDSRYVVDAMAQGWAVSWRARGWRLSGKRGMAKNVDLWQRLLALCEVHDVTFQWVRGHAGHAANERCDVLATDACSRAPDEGMVDEGYDGATQ